MFDFLMFTTVKAFLRMVSLAYAIQYRATDRTLTDEEVTPAFEHLLSSIKEKLKLEIR